MKSKKEIYYEYFEQVIKPKVLAYETYRRKLLAKVSILTLLCFLAGGAFAFSAIYIVFYNNSILFLFPVVLFIMYAFILRGIISVIIAGKEFYKKLSDEVLPLFMKPVANFIAWPKNQNTATVLDSQLFKNFDTQDDIATYFGVYKGTNILFSATQLTLPVKGITKPNLFKGTLIQLEFEKSINNHVIIFSKNERKFNHFKQFNPHIEDMNKFVYVFAKKPQKIDFITEEFWNKIKPFGEKYSAKGFEMSYKNNTVLIALRQKRPLQFGSLFRSLLIAKNYDELIDKFIAIYDLIGILQANQLE